MRSYPAAAMRMALRESAAAPISLVKVGTDVDVGADQCVGRGFVVDKLGVDPFDWFGDREWWDAGIRVVTAVYDYAEFVGH